MAVVMAATSAASDSWARRKERLFFFRILLLKMTTWGRGERSRETHSHAASPPPSYISLIREKE